MANNVPLIVFPAKDYVGYKAGNLEVGLNPNGTAVISYADTDDIQASLRYWAASLTNLGKPGNGKHKDCAQYGEGDGEF